MDRKKNIVNEDKPVKIILDTDMGSDCDDVGAMALLFTYIKKGKAELLATIYSSGKVPYGAAVLDAINIFYNHKDIPVGAYHGEDVGDPQDKMDAAGLTYSGKYNNRFNYNYETTEQTNLNRKLLSEQNDSSITYVTIGHTKALYDLLKSKPDEFSELSGHDLIQSKIKKWIALGALGASNREGNLKKDWNFFFNGTSEYTEYLVNHFPSQIVFIDAGTDVLTGKSLNLTKDGNIIKDSYKQWLWNYQRKSLDDQRPSWDLAAVYYAVEGLGDFLEEENPGFLEFSAENGCRWIEGTSAKRQKFIVQKKNVNEIFAEYLNNMIIKGFPEEWLEAL
jgi:inosine-uridine nucleoside N-ribohydrolase